MKLQEKEASAYEAEYQKITKRLMREMPPFKEAEQLIDIGGQDRNQGTINFNGYTITLADGTVPSK